MYVCRFCQFCQFSFAHLSLSHLLHALSHTRGTAKTDETSKCLLQLNKKGVAGTDAALPKPTKPVVVEL